MSEDENPKATSIKALFREPKAIEEDFVNTYRNFPELWDSKHRHYTNKYKRNAALDVLLEIMKRWNPSATRFNVRQKINILRSCYRKDYRKHLASKRIGPDGEVFYEYEPRNWKFHALSFITDRERSNNTDIVEINMDENNFEDGASDGSTSGNEGSSAHASDVLASLTDDKSYRKKSYVKKQKPEKRLKVELDSEYYVENDDMFVRELEAIGSNVTCKLKRMNPHQRYHAELLINKVLISGLKNELTDDTDLTEVYKP